MIRRLLVAWTLALGLGGAQAEESTPDSFAALLAEAGMEFTLPDGFRELPVQVVHDGITLHLGDYRSGAYRRADIITADQRLQAASEFRTHIGAAIAIHAQHGRYFGQPFDRPAHGQHARMQNI